MWKKWLLATGSVTAILTMGFYLSREPSARHSTSENTAGGKALIAQVAREHLFSICEHERYGYISGNGDVVIKPTFDEAYDFSDGLGLVKAGGRYGYIDRKGEYIIPPPLRSRRQF